MRAKQTKFETLEFGDLKLEFLIRAKPGIFAKVSHTLQSKTIKRFSLIYLKRTSFWYKLCHLFYYYHSIIRPSMSLLFVVNKYFFFDLRRIFLCIFLDDFGRAHGAMVLNKKPLFEASAVEIVAARSDFSRNQHV